MKNLIILGNNSRWLQSYFNNFLFFDKDKISNYKISVIVDDRNFNFESISNVLLPYKNINLTCVRGSTLIENYLKENKSLSPNSILYIKYYHLILKMLLPLWAFRSGIKEFFYTDDDVFVFRDLSNFFDNYKNIFPKDFYPFSSEEVKELNLIFNSSLEKPPYISTGHFLFNYDSSYEEYLLKFLSSSYFIDRFLAKHFDTENLTFKTKGKYYNSFFDDQRFFSFFLVKEKDLSFFSAKNVLSLITKWEKNKNQSKLLENIKKAKYYLIHYGADKDIHNTKIEEVLNG